MSENVYTQEGVAVRFKNYLMANGLRQTKERFAILKAAYELPGTFTIEDLQQLLAEQRFHVSTATLYSTTQLLVQANLLLRHPFSSSTTIFEHIADDKPRCYQICSNCHRITRIKSKEVATNINSYHPRRFHVTHRVLYVFGTCPKCLSAFRKNLKQINNPHTDETAR
ncbi:MAG: transcriptional repressor [Bacteroidaceae bacterium]|nr:transcriptional repressor [Bacteroidaceae bacterium]